MRGSASRLGGGCRPVCCCFRWDSIGDSIVCCVVLFPTGLKKGALVQMGFQIRLFPQEDLLLISVLARFRPEGGHLSAADGRAGAGAPAWIQPLSLLENLRGQGAASDDQKVMIVVIYPICVVICVTVSLIVLHSVGSSFGRLDTNAGVDPRNGFALGETPLHELLSAYPLLPKSIAPPSNVLVDRVVESLRLSTAQRHISLASHVDAADAAMIV